MNTIYKTKVIYYGIRNTNRGKITVDSSSLMKFCSIKNGNLIKKRSIIEISRVETIFRITGRKVTPISSKTIEIF